MYLSFINEFEKIATETPSQPAKRTTMQTIADISPFILGFGAGNLTAGVLKEQLSKVNNPTLKTIAKVGIPLAGGALSYMVLPKLQAKWKEALTGQKPQNEAGSKVTTPSSS